MLLNCDLPHVPWVLTVDQVFGRNAQCCGHGTKAGAETGGVLHRAFSPPVSFDNQFHYPLPYCCRLSITTPRRRGCAGTGSRSFSAGAKMTSLHYGRNIHPLNATINAVSETSGRSRHQSKHPSLASAFSTPQSASPARNVRRGYHPGWHRAQSGRAWPDNR